MATPIALNPYAAMSLASIAYTDEDNEADQKKDMQAALTALPASANGPWTLTWGPANNDGILASVALGANGQYGLAFRGSLSEDDATGFLANWVEDLDAFELVTWLYPQSVSGAQISSGMNAALDQALGLTDPTTGVSLLDYLRSVLTAQNSQLLVTGHSLGGALAAVAATWLFDQLPRSGQAQDVAITPYTFAAPSVGNAQFAAYYNQSFPTSYRCVNTQDIIPMAWASLGTVVEQYAAPGQLLGSYSLILWSAVEAARLAVGSQYVVTNQGVGTTVLFQGPAIVAGNTFAQTASAQHSGAVYLGQVKPAGTDSRKST